MKKIAIVDDDVHVGDMLAEVLQREEYDICRAYSGTEAIYLLTGERPDLVLLDLCLPGLSGEDLLPKLKGIPVIVVSARAGVEDKVKLLLEGAVDYVTKPFDVRELLARIRAQLRLAETAGANEVLSYKNLEVDLTAHQVRVEMEPVHLTRTEYAILRALMENPRQVMTKSLLLERLSQDTPDCTESSLKIHVSNLRKKLREKSNVDYIEAVWGIGFKMKED